MNYLVITEKVSARKAFEAALGGRSGNYDGYNFTLINLHGHLMRLANPEHQINDVNWSDKVSQWSDITAIPWKLDRFLWKKTYIKGIDPRTKRVKSTKDEVAAIKAQAKNFDAIVIATDTDPTGEGDLLCQEVINDINWKKKVYRCRFKDEQKDAILDAMQQSKLEDVSDAESNGMYLRGLARERFDYGTMQASRLATRFAREQSYDVVIRPGRLKSVIVTLIYQQQRARDSFVVKDQYQAMFVDENGNKFMNAKANKYDTRSLAENDASHLHQSPITVSDTVRKTTSAPKLLDLSRLGIVLGNYGVGLDALKNTYQKMYEANLVSYPRTDDSEITQGQWDALMPLVDDIADLVGVDKSLLVNRTSRPKYVSDKDLSHGANRPGSVLPNSLDELEKTYGKTGVLIYTVLAKSFLATLAADYEYDVTKAFVTEFPEYKASKNVPAKLGYKEIVSDIEKATSDKKKNENDNASQFGTVAKPDVHVGKTTPPQKPSRKFVINYLERNNVGTGATRLSALVELMEKSKHKDPVMVEKKGTFVLTPEGVLSGAVMADTMLSSVKVTKQLFEMMVQVGDKRIPIQNIYKALDMIIMKDKDKMESNAQALDKDSYLEGRLPHKKANSQAKFKGVFAPTGEQVSFKNVFMNHRFTQPEADALLKGNTIKIDVLVKQKYKKSVSGKLEKQSFKDKKGEAVTYWGFKVLDWG